MQGFLREACAAADFCSTLKHDWLEHQVIRPLRAEKSKSLAAEDDKTLPVMLSTLDEWVKEAKRFAEEALEGYSPMQLVDRGSLGQLSEEVRLLVREGVHQAYLDQQVVQPLVEELRKAITSFEIAAEVLVRAWEHDGVSRQGSIEVFEAAAVRLRDVLNRFPPGVVL